MGASLEREVYLGGNQTDANHYAQYVEDGRRTPIMGFMSVKPGL